MADNDISTKGEAESLAGIKRLPNWEYRQPSQAQRDILQNDCFLILKGETPEEIKASFDHACEMLGWNNGI